jgi:hypothetical protein
MMFGYGAAFLAKLISPVVQRGFGEIFLQSQLPDADWVRSKHFAYNALFPSLGNTRHDK